MTVYSFKTQLNIGQEAEALATTLLSKLGKVEQVSVADQRTGLGDIRILSSIKPTNRYLVGRTIEIKSDKTSERTGNAFIELTVGDQPGWVHKTRADYVIYISGDWWYTFKPEACRRMLEEWANKYPIRTIKNTSWEATGICVLLTELETVCLTKRTLTEVNSNPELLFTSTPIDCSYLPNRVSRACEQRATACGPTR